MAVKSGIKLDANWRALGQTLHPGKFRRRLERHLGKAIARSGKVAERAIRRQIQGKKLTKNAALTVAIKGANNPLTDFGELFKAVTSKMIGHYKVFAGILRTEGVYGIAKFLHEGGDIPVTKKMRGLFYVLWLASLDAEDGEGRLKGAYGGRAAELFARFQDWKPLRASTAVIRVPARRFITGIADDPRLRTSVEEGWPHAIQRALRVKGKR